MTLDAWMKANKVQNAEMAERIGVHVISISKYRTGTTIPRRGTMEAITRETSGQVTGADFYASTAERPAGVSEQRDEAA